MTLDIIDQTKENVPNEELYHLNHSTWIAQEATRLGFPVAGFMHEVYPDAVILIPPMFRFDWKKKRVVVGRVLEIWQDQEGGPTRLILINEDGIQSTHMYGESYPVHFALPETTEDKFRN